jgi:hypothetical protein
MTYPNRRSNENTNGLLRQYKRTDFSIYSHDQLDAITLSLNLGLEKHSAEKHCSPFIPSLWLGHNCKPIRFTNPCYICYLRPPDILQTKAMSMASAKRG